MRESKNKGISKISARVKVNFLFHLLEHLEDNGKIVSSLIPIYAYA